MTLTNKFKEKSAKVVGDQTGLRRGEDDVDAAVRWDIVSTHALSISKDCRLDCTIEIINFRSVADLSVFEVVWFRWSGPLAHPTRYRLFDQKWGSDQEVRSPSASVSAILQLMLNHFGFLVPSLRNHRRIQTFLSISK
jgi:hypothetical protein